MRDSNRKPKKPARKLAPKPKAKAKAKGDPWRDKSLPFSLRQTDGTRPLKRELPFDPNKPGHPSPNPSPSPWPSPSPQPV